MLIRKYRQYKPRGPLMSSLKHVICSRRRVLSSSGWYISTTSPILASGWSFGFNTRSSAELRKKKRQDIETFVQLEVQPRVLLNTYCWSSFDANTIWTISFWWFFWFCSGSAVVDIHYFNQFRPKWMADDSSSRRSNQLTLNRKSIKFVFSFPFCVGINFFFFNYLSFIFNVFQFDGALLWIKSRNCQNQVIWHCSHA